MTTRKLEIVEHDHDPGEGKAGQHNTVVLKDDKIYAGSGVTELIDSIEHKLAGHLGHQPSDQELFEELTHYSNGYIGGREI